jgi:hypothetical protein
MQASHRSCRIAFLLSRLVVMHRWANGDIYNGEWVDGKKQGNGKFT